MRSGTVAASFFVAAILLTGTAQAAGKATPTPTPKAKAAASPSPKPAASATPRPAATPDDMDMPTVGEDEPAAGGGGAGGKGGHELVGGGGGGDEWDDRSRGGGMIMGIRLGAHAFQPAGIVGDGGLALELTAAMPLRGAWYIAGVAGYHTGFEKAGGDKKRRFFDAEFGAVEAQWRHNVGRLNVLAGGGIGVLSGNAALITLPDGSGASDSGVGPVVHVVTAGEYVVGRMGLVTELRYGFSPVGFTKTKETIGMGGLTLGFGVDLAF